MIKYYLYWSTCELELLENYQWLGLGGKGDESYHKLVIKRENANIASRIQEFLFPFEI
jgi:hypothetical protein